jgi:transcription factor Ssl1
MLQYVKVIIIININIIISIIHHLFIYLLRAISAALARDVPSQCHACHLLLISGPHLAKSYHHLFPVKPFDETRVELVKSEDGDIQPRYCQGCRARLETEGPQSREVTALKCPDCACLVCFECDLYIHGTLHNCPGCELQLGAAEAATASGLP